VRTIPAKHQFMIAGALALLMAFTRSPQIHGSELLHGSSWAVLFAVGVYLRSAFALPAFLGLAFVLDAAAIGWGGISAYCFTPAYAMLLPAYASLWAAGRWYAGQYCFAPSTVGPLAASAFIAAVVCEAFASGGFYWLSGRFADPTVAEFVAREARYFPAYLATMFFWLGAGAIVHTIVATVHERRQQGAGSQAA